MDPYYLYSQVADSQLPQTRSFPPDAVTRLRSQPLGLKVHEKGPKLTYHLV